MLKIFVGSLRHFPAEELLDLLGRHRHSGTLTAEFHQKTTRIGFVEGTIVAAYSTDPRLQLMTLLAKCGLMKDEDATETAEVDPRHLKFHGAEVVLDLFMAGEGTFAFTDDAPHEKAFEIDPAELIAEGVGRAAEARRVLQLYPEPRSVLRVIESAGGQPHITLTPEEFRLLVRIGSGRSLEDVSHQVGIPPFELYPMIHNLERSGLLRVEPPAPEAPPQELIHPDLLRAVAPPPLPMTSAALPAEVAAPEPPLSRPRARKPVGSLTPDASTSGDVQMLIDDEYTIGRDRSNRIPIHDGSVSSRHARILRTMEGFTIEDLQSRNGTFVNGEKVVQRRALENNDLIRIGKVLLTFNLAQEYSPEITEPQFKHP
ncbi:MAG TPA: FHA domain-containing protein [Thermoanaerobaculia bacterium]|nr:FHA domain-containing protein [Thermoanaerobaculia bacterium]